MKLVVQVGWASNHPSGVSQADIRKHCAQTDPNTIDGAVHQHLGGTWWFWDECDGADECGPYGTKEEAREAVRRYTESL